jgi:hypothetical protein
MKIKSSLLGLMIMIILLGGIFGAQISGFWNTKGQPGMGGGTASPQTASIPAEIRGSFSLSEISRQFDIPLDILLEAFGLEKVTGAENIRSGNLEDFYEDIMQLETEIGNGSVKLFVALYKGFACEVDEPTFLPEMAVKILIDRGIEDKWQKYISEHSILMLPLSAEDLALSVKFINQVQDNNDAWKIVGTTSFQEVIDRGVSREEIELILGKSIPSPLTGVKQYCEEQGLQFGTVKNKLEEKVYKEAGLSTRSY